MRDTLSNMVSCFLKSHQQTPMTLSVNLLCRYSFLHGVMHNTFSNMVSLLSKEPSTSVYDEQLFIVFAYLLMLKVFYFVFKYSVNTCCITLQTHV